MRWAIVPNGSETMTKDEQKTYDQGVYARTLGLSEADNPYRGYARISPIGYVWLAGFRGIVFDSDKGS